jgi:hypothetical protein
MARRAALIVCIALGSTFFDRSAAAEKNKVSAPANKAELDRLKQALETGNEPEKLAALDELGRQAGANVAPAALRVNEVLVRGGSVALVTRALDAAGKLAQPSSTLAIVPYSRHRSSEIRVAATKALAHTGGPDAITALRASLHGDDRAARGFAASGLATLKAKASIADLFSVLAKDVPEAAGAIGELCEGAECAKFVDLLGRLPFDLMQSGLAPLLLRPESEVPAEFKLDVLERLRKLQTEEAQKFLETIRSSYPENGNAWVKYGLEQAVGNKPVQLPPKGVAAPKGAESPSASGSTKQKGKAK